MSVVAILANLEATANRKALQRDIGVCFLYAVLVAAFFWQLLFIPDVQLPKGGGDLASFLYPAYAFAAQQLQQGVFPLWNPYLFSGAPFAADVQSGLYYPPNLLAFLLARPFTYQSIEALAIFHYLLAAIFTYFCAREFRIAPLGAFAAGLIFAFSGFATAHLAHLNMLAAATWLPLIVLLFHRATSRGSLGWAAGAGAALGISTLAGHTQISLYIVWFVVAYWLWSLWLASRRHGEKAIGTSANQPPSVRRVLATVPVCFATALGLAAVQLLPLAELLRYSLRSDVTYAKAVEFAASPLGLITLFVPHFFGDSPSEYWGLRWSLTEVYGYAGITALLLVALGLWVARPWRRWMVFFLAIAVVSLLLSLGEQTALYGLLYRFVPGFDKVRAPGRFLVLFDFAVALLAARGIDLLTIRLPARSRPAFSMFLKRGGLTWAAAVFLAGPAFYYALLTSQDKDPAIFRRVAVAIDSFNLAILLLAAGLCLLLIHRRRWLRITPFLAIGLLALDLFSANGTLNTVADDVLRGYDHPAIVRYLQSEARRARIDTDTGIADVWQPDSGLLYGLSEARGLFNPFSLADYERYWTSLGSRSVPGYDLLAAGFLVGRKDVALDRDKFKLAFDGDPELNVYRNEAALPRAFVVGAAEAVPRDQQLARLSTKDFDPRRTVLLESGTSVLQTSPTTGKVLSLGYPSPNEIDVSVENSAPAYLFFSEVYYPGWRATVDGVETPVLRADYTFRAVALPTGAQQVELLFEPLLWRAGLAISAATLLTLVGWAIVRVWFRRTRLQQLQRIRE